MWSSLFICQLYLSRIFYIYEYLIGSHININTPVLSISNPFKNILFHFDMYITKWIAHHFKNGIHIITIQRRTYNIQGLFRQWKCFVIVWIKYPISIYNNCVIYITNRVHQLHQGNMFTDIIKNIKIPICIKVLDIIIKTTPPLILFLVNYDWVSNCDPIRITMRLTYQWFFDTS